MPEDNSYLNTRKSWDNRSKGHITRERQWRNIAFFSSATAVVAVAGLVWAGSQSRVVPFVIALDGDKPIALGRAEQITNTNKRLVASALFTWIQDLRTVTSDPEAQRRAIARVYSHIGQSTQAQAAISDWYRAGDPFVRARTETVAVNPKSVLPLTDQSMQIEWEEESRDSYGKLLTRKVWRGSFIIATVPPTDDRTARENPLGVYVTQATWTEVL
jgi:type IV secretion system protein VirB5